MIRILSIFAFAALPSSVIAAAYDRPTPQAQSATAEFWFFVASATLVVALIAVGLLVARR